MAKILFLVPQTQSHKDLMESLTHDGHTCAAVHTPETEPQHWAEDLPDLAILDTAFPWSQTAPMLNILTQANRPVIFLYHDRTNAAHMKAMYHGLCEVMSVRSRGSALRRTVRRLLAESGSKLVYGSLVLDTVHHTAVMDGRHLSLTTQEFSLLQALMESPNTAISREDLLRNAWGYLAIGETRTVDVHVQRLRRKIGAACIETVYRTGYRLTMA